MVLTGARDRLRRSDHPLTRALSRNQLARSNLILHQLNLCQLHNDKIQIIDLAVPHGRAHAATRTVGYFDPCSERSTMNKTILKHVDHQPHRPDDLVWAM